MGEKSALPGGISFHILSKDETPSKLCMFQGTAYALEHLDFPASVICKNFSE